MQTVIEKTGKVLDVYSISYSLPCSFVELAGKFAQQPGTVALLSGGDTSGAKNNFLGIWPWLEIRGKGKSLQFYTPQEKIDLQVDPFSALQELLKSLHLQGFAGQDPVKAGFFGYFAYDLKDQLEKLPRTCIKDLPLPDLLLYAHGLILHQEKETNQAKIHIPIFKKGEPEGLLRKFLRQAESKFESGQEKNQKCRLRNLRSERSKASYLQSVENILEYIADGHVYQVNLSQRFEASYTGQGYTLFKELFSQNPAPFFAYINCKEHEIISTSPERFLVVDQDLVKTEPIKGTIPRGRDIKEDRENAEKLLKSEKDGAELSMIVDLLRNDLGKVCLAGTVKVKEHKRLESYANVHHLVSLVQGRLRPECDCVDLLKACFPGGSITGCPKVRSMEIIDEQEACARHVYTGSIGYLSFHGSMDLSIAIRTAIYYQNKLYFSVGGGIVFDSEPESEYQETLDKGQTVFRAFERGIKESQENLRSGYSSQSNPESTGDQLDENLNHFRNNEDWVWYNGRILPENEVRISPFCPGLEYGFGFFETIRADQGRAIHLKEHIERFNQAWETLFQKEVLDLTFEDLFSQVLKANGLERKVARIKLMAFFDSWPEDEAKQAVLVKAQKYEHRLKSLGKYGLELKTYPYPRQFPLAQFKTLNHLYYFMAGKWARQNQADEALILNPDRSISESNSAGLILLKDDRAWLPESLHVLPSIMQDKIKQELAGAGIKVDSRRIFPEDIDTKDSLLLCNSLIGAVPALSVDQRLLQPDLSLCRSLNQAVLNIATP